MRFLSLAQGDPIGKDLLNKLVETRYGTSPPAMDSLRITFEGRTSARLGPFPVWAKVNATATYRFPALMRWDFRIRLLRFLRSAYTTSFDGDIVYEQQGFNITRNETDDLIESARRRAWAESILFISPLIADHRVRVEAIDSHAFIAHMPGVPGDPAIVRLNEDNGLAEIEVERVDPSDGQRKRQILRTPGELVNIDGLIVPSVIHRYWEDEMFMELRPITAERNPELDGATFTLQEEDPLAVLDEDDEPTGDDV